MRKILVCQHVPFEILGTLDPLFRNAGFRIRYVNFGRFPDAQPSLSSYNGLIVLGGPMSAYEDERHPHLPTEVRLIEEAIERGIPVLGICLGAQLIARALGSEVRRHEEKEIGWYEVSPTSAAADDPLFSHFRASEKVYQWHGDTFDIPAGAVHLVSSPSCASQAFRYNHNVYGLQFHLEADERLIERWLRVPFHRREIEELDGRIDPDTIRRQTADNIAELKRLSDLTFGQFVRMFGERTRRRVLPSR